MKKTMTTILLALVVMTGWAQEQVFKPFVTDSVDFVIEGIVSEGSDSVCLRPRPYIRHEMYPAHNGRFHIVTRQPQYKFLQLEDAKNGLTTVIVDKQPARVVVDFRTNTIVEGSALNKRFNRYMLVEDQLEYEMELHEKDADRSIYDSLEVELNKAEWKSIVENFDNVIPVYNLALNGQYPMITPDQLKECLKEEHAFVHHPDMEVVWKFYWAMQKRLPGKDYYDLELPDTTGTMHRLSEYVGKGHYVLLDFWASWCGPCIGSMPMMKTFHETYGPRGLQIIGISLDSKRDAWVSAIKRFNLPWVHLSDLKGWKSIASDTYGVRAIPETVIIDPNGKIVSTGLRDKDLKAKLAEIFTE